MEYILETQDLTKVYGNKEAAKDINLHIAEGQICGPSEGHSLKDKTQ